MNYSEKIEIGDGYVILNDVKYIRKEPEVKKITYNNVMKWCVDEDKYIDTNALFSLALTAKYLNRLSEGDGLDYCLYKNGTEKIGVSYNSDHYTGRIYFKSEALAQQAVEILGEKTVIEALKFGSK